MKQKVFYSTISKDGYIIDMSKEFPDVQSACSFFEEIKTVSITKPIIADINYERNENGNRF